MKKSATAILFLFYLSPVFATLNTPTLTSPSIGSLNNDPNVLLDWSSTTGATGYEYKVGTNSGLVGANILTVSGTSQASTSNLLFGTVYYWQVRAIKTSAPVDSSSWSAIWNFTTIDLLTLVSPANGVLNQEPNVLLDWTGIFGITNYDYQWDTVSTFSSPLYYYASVGATSQVSTANLRFGTKYFWRVRARNSADTTQWSATWNFTTIDQLTLVSPANGGLIQEPNVLLDWTGIFGISNYDYQWDTASTFSSSLNYYASVGATSQVSTANLRFGTKYFWRVRARHSADTTQWSATWNFTTIDQLTLVSPANGGLIQEPNVLLDWTGIFGITNYDYQWDTVSNFSSPLYYYASVGATSQVSSANLRFGTKYFWRVRARHSADTTQWSETWNFTTIDQLTLVSPANGGLIQEPNVLLDWTGIFGITNYDYQWDTVSTFSSPLYYYASVGATSQVSSANLRFGTKYFWRVRARHAADTTQWSAVWNFTTIDYLTHVSPADNSTGISLNPLIDWTGILGITGYQYRYSTSSNFSNPSLSTIGAISQANLVSLSYGTQYYWQVRTFHSADTSEWSLPWSFTTLYQITNAPALISPANGAINIPMTGASLQWASVSNATSYEYQLDDNSTFSSPVSNSVSGLTDLTGNLLPNATYYWKVRAGNGSGYSPWSAAWSFNTELTTDITNQSETEKFSVYPNPSNGKFIIKGNSNINTIEIYNALGEQVFLSECKNIKSEIDLSSQPKGVYFVKLFLIGEEGSGLEAHTEKIIVR